MLIANFTKGYKLEVLTVVEGLVTILRLTLVKADLILMTGKWC